MKKNEEVPQTSISQASSIEEIAEFWDTHSLDDYWDQTREIEFDVRAERRRRISKGAPPSIPVVMEEVADPKEIAEFQARWAQAQRNSDWLQAHAHEIYTQHRGKFIVVAGEELFVGDTPEEALAQARAAHPEDEGRIIRYIYPKKMVRVYAN